MMWKAILQVWGVIVLASVSLFTFASGAVYTQDKLNIVVSAKEPIFTLHLQSNPTTGYSWFLREYDPHFIAPLSHHVIKPATRMVGAPGFEDWVFRVKASGFTVPHQLQIRMVYARPFESTAVGSERVFRVTTIC